MPTSLSHRMRFGPFAVLVGSYRDVELARTHPLWRLIDGFGRASGFSQLWLSGLAAGPVGEWIKTVSAGASEAGLADVVHRATDGNPFFVRELDLDSVTHGDFTGDHGAAPSCRDRCEVAASWLASTALHRAAVGCAA